MPVSWSYTRVSFLVQLGEEKKNGTAMETLDMPEMINDCSLLIMSSPRVKRRDVAHLALPCLATARFFFLFFAEHEQSTSTAKGQSYRLDALRRVSSDDEDQEERREGNPDGCVARIEG